MKNIELFGKITAKKLDKVRNKKSEHLGNQYWRLAVELENKPEIKEILVFENYLETKEIYQKLEDWNHYRQNYLFTCQRKPGAGKVYRLINWKQIKHGSN